MRQAPLNVIDAAQAAQLATGVRASVSLAQWALESAWGAKCTGQFNFFGVKALPGQPSTLCWTHEVVAGQLVSCQQPFLNYPDLETGFLAHARQLISGHFEAAAPLVANVAAFIKAIAPIYATDPDYAAKLFALISDEQFARYDDPSPATA